MFHVILWLVAGILTMMCKDEKVYKINYFLTWIVLMFYLFDKYLVV